MYTMWQKISDYQFKAYFAYKRFMQDLKDDERGLSGVVVAVLLILVAVLAIVFIWGGLSGLLGEWWKNITKGAGDFENIQPTT